VGWTTYRNSYVLGGREVPSVNSVAQCQLACVNDSTCTGVDYNPYNPSGQRCYIISSNPSVIKLGEAPGVVHYSINRTCTGRMIFAIILPETMLIIHVKFASNGTLSQNIDVILAFSKLICMLCWHYLFLIPLLM